MIDPDKLKPLLFALNVEFGLTFNDIREDGETIWLHWIGLPEKVAWMPKQQLCVQMEAFINKFMGIEDRVIPYHPGTEEDKKIAEAFQKGWDMGYKCGSYKL